MAGDQLRDATGPELSDVVRAARMRFAFVQSRLPLISSTVLGAALALGLVNLVSHTTLVVWVLGVCLLSVIRLVLTSVYPAHPSPAEVRAWEWRFLASVGAVALWWGLGSLWLIEGSDTSRFLVFTFLMLMAGSNTASYSAHPRAVALTVLGLTGPITVAFALEGDALHAMAALGAAAFVVAALRSVRRLGKLFEETHRLAHELERERDRAELLARTDGLTGLDNRRAFYERGEAAVRQAARYRRPLSMIMLDLDHFKVVNDSHGHSAGDRVLMAVATVLRENHRATDAVGRLGGEEFAVLLPETPLREALATAERIRTTLSLSIVEWEGRRIRCTSSLGVAQHEGEETFQELVARADQALYDAKRAGRNRVCAWSPERTSVSGQLVRTSA